VIQIEVTTFPDGRIAGIALSGHAELAAAGSDILCAAVSVLADNLGASLTTLLGMPAQIDSAKGLYRLQIAETDHSDAAELLFQSALLGFRTLAEQYPERIELRLRK
tara:strand:+ start:46 stop:366 length:321 start_codon:yes stop_codon:yes gene_type:complete